MSDTSNELATKYRPQTFEEVIGQPQAVASIKTVLKRQSSRSFILTGPSGTGKTTLGRIIATTVGAVKSAIVEVDAASNTGVDAMREILEMTQYRGFGGAGRVFIIDECHMLSANAWNSMLKGIEEPPPGIYWVLCTTEPTKIPKTIKTRCVQYDLQPVGVDDIYTLIK